MVTRVLFVDVAALGELHSNGPTALGDGRNGLNALNHGWIVDDGELRAVDADIAPAAACQETANSAECETERDGRGSGRGASRRRNRAVKILSRN